MKQTAMSVIRCVLLLPALLQAAGRLSSARLTEKDTILLGGFTNNMGDEAFSGSLEQPLRTALEESPFLSILPEARVAAALKEMRQAAGRSLTPELTRQVCQRTHSQAYITGSLSREGAEFLIVLDAVDCDSSQPLVKVQAATWGKDKVVDTLG